VVIVLAQATNVGSPGRPVRQYAGQLVQPFRSVLLVDGTDGTRMSTASTLPEDSDNLDS
jgi:hypothetical protein